MAKGAKTIDKDLGQKQIVRELKKAKGSFVTVGIHAKEHEYESGASVQMVGTVHEFGLPEKNIPERSFLRSTYDKNKEFWRKMTVDLFYKVLQRSITVETALKQIGILQVSAVQGTLLKGDFAELKTSTIRARKRGGLNSKRPLVATRKLWRSINFEVTVK